MDVRNEQRNYKKNERQFRICTAQLTVQRAYVE
jgi:hypothetical protein